MREYNNELKIIQYNGINLNRVNNEQRTKVNHKVNNNAKRVSISKKGITIKIY